MKNVLIFGPDPRLVGGVSMHLRRFLIFSKKYDNKITINIHDIKRNKIKNLFSNFFLADIVHIQLVHNLKVFIAIVSRLSGKRVIYTHHNSRVKNRFYFKLINLLSNVVILVNNQEIDLKHLNINKIRHIPAFLPPYSFEELPKYINDKIVKSDFVISSNCSKYTLLEGKDLYGFDIIIKSYVDFIVEKKLENILLILVDPSGSTEDYVNSLRLEYPLLNDNNILYVNKAIDFSTLIKKSNVTIRATRSDGDSLSVRESLYLGVPIVASDVTYRPEGTILFQNENSDDLKNVLLNLYYNQDTATFIEPTNFADSIVDVYFEED